MVSATKRKKRFARMLTERWGEKPHLYNADLHEPYPQEICKRLERKGCKCEVMPSIREEYAYRDYLNVWSNCKFTRDVISR